MSPAQRVRAPELEGRGFVHGEPLSLAALRGRVVLLDFWTFCCVNCLHVLDELRALEERFGDDLVVIGVHSPKFPHEGDAEALAQAVARYDVRHPVLDDPELRTWRAYTVRAWPTLVLIDPEGYVALHVSGEGRGPQLAAAVETLIAAHAAGGTLRRGPLAAVPAAPPATPPTALRFPGKVAHDPQRGIVAIADTGHHRIVLVEPDGRLVATVGSGTAGEDDGPFPSACFRSPQGVCFWEDVLWVADTGNHRLRRVDLAAGEVSTAATPRLRSPWDVAPFGGVLVIAMAGSHQLWGFDPSSGRVGLVAGNGREGLVDGDPDRAELAQPSGLAPLGQQLGLVDAETSSLRALVPRPGGDGLALATAVGTGLFDFGDRDGPGPSAQLQHPLGLAAVEDGWVVADTYNHRLRRYRAADGRLQTLAGSCAGFGDGAAQEARFDEPSGLVQVGDALLVADTNNHVVRRVELASGQVSTLLLSGLERPGALPRILPPATLAEQSDIGVVVRLEPPAGARVDPAAGSAPVRVRVTADPPELLRAPVEQVDRALPSRLVLRTAGTGSGTLRIDVRAAVCDEQGAACRLVEASWLLPAVLAPGGAEQLQVA